MSEEMPELDELGAREETLRLSEEIRALAKRTEALLERAALLPSTQETLQRLEEGDESSPSYGYLLCADLEEAQETLAHVAETLGNDARWTQEELAEEHRRLEAEIADWEAEHGPLS
jgi:prefoldin subunit 5